MKMIRISLKAKLVGIIEISVLLVSLAAGITISLVLQNVFEQRVFAQLQSVTVLKQDQISEYVNSIVKENEYIANQGDSSLYLHSFLSSSGSSDETLLKNELNQLSAYSNEFTDFFVLNTNGEVILATNADDIGKIRSSEAYFLNAKETTYVQNIAYDIALGVPTIMVGTPVKSEEGDLLGVLVGRVSVDNINRLLLQRAGLGDTGETFLVNSNNLVVSDLRKEAGAAMKRTIFNPQISRCLLGDSFAARVTDYHGDNVFGYYSWFPEFSSCIGTKVDSSEVLVAIQTAFTIILGTMIGIGVFMGISSYLFSLRLFRPLQTLRDEVRKVKEGDFDVHVEALSNDEIGDVADSFNDMAGKLKISYGSLEQKVKEKTKELEDKVGELEKMNDLMIGRELTMIELKKKLEEKNKK